MRPPAGNLPRRVLAVFPHPDDEAITCAGTLRRFVRSGATVTLVLLTAGERGNRAGVNDPVLQATRRQEAKAAARVLGISRLIQADFGDGRLEEQRGELESYLSNLLPTLEPDLIITHDLAGLSGHPDHIACSEVLTGLRRDQFRDLRLWYATLPSGLVRILDAVGQMRLRKDIAARRATPTHAVFVGAHLLAKLRAVNAHRSQRQALGKGLGRVLPTWFLVGIQPLEYFSEVA